MLFVYVSMHVCILANMLMLLEERYLDSGIMAAKNLPFHCINKLLFKIYLNGKQIFQVVFFYCIFLFNLI